MEALLEGFSSRIKTKVREDFKMLLCDPSACSSEHLNLLHKLLLDDRGQLNAATWKDYLHTIMERGTDSTPQILRLVNKALELLDEDEHRNNPDFVSIHLYSIQLYADTDIMTALSQFDYLMKRKIGKTNSSLYILWSKLIIKNGENDGVDLKGAAAEVLVQGLTRNAQPQKEHLLSLLKEISPEDAHNYINSRAATEYGDEGKNSVSADRNDKEIEYNDENNKSPKSTNSIQRRRSMRLTCASGDTADSSHCTTSSVGSKRRTGLSSLGKLGAVSKCARVVRGKDKADDSDEDVDNKDSANTITSDNEDEDTVRMQTRTTNGEAGNTSPRSDTYHVDAVENINVVCSPSSTIEQNQRMHRTPGSTTATTHTINITEGHTHGSLNSSTNSSLSSTSSNSSASANAGATTTTSTTKSTAAKKQKADLSKYVDDNLRNFDANVLLRRNVSKDSSSNNKSDRKIVFARTFAPKVQTHVPSFAAAASTTNNDNGSNANTPSTNVTNSVKKTEGSTRAGQLAAGTGGFSAYTSSMIDTSVLLDTSIMDTSLDSTIQNGVGNTTLNNTETLTIVAPVSSEDNANDAPMSSLDMSVTMTMNEATAIVRLAQVQSQQASLTSLLQYGGKKNTVVASSGTSTLSSAVEESGISFKTTGGLRPVSSTNHIPSTSISQSTERRVSFAGGSDEAKAKDSVSSSSSISMFDPSKNSITFQGKHYNRIGVLGKGGSSCVHRILDSNGSIYAYKKVNVTGIDDSDTVFDSYANEINLLQRLKGSVHIIELIDAEINRDDMYIAMVMEAGEVDLSKVLKDRQTSLAAKYPPIPLNGTATNNSSIPIGQPFMNPFFSRMVWQEMLEAVDYIHENRIVHGDLKPANFVFVKGHLKLIDFGIAKAINDHTTNIYRDSQIGTINYMAPEAIAPAQDICGQGSDERA